MTQSTAEHLANRAKAARSLDIGSIDVSVNVVESLITEHNRLVDAFEQLAAAVSALDFDSTESALPQTEDQWIEFVRNVQERAQKVIDTTGDLATVGR